MIESEETANRVGKYLKRMLTREQPPCQFSIEELAEQLDMAEKEACLGLGCSTGELRKAVFDMVNRIVWLPVAQKKP